MYLEKQLTYLKKMDHFASCQKTLIVDGEPNVCPEQFEIVRVDRNKERYNWAKAWTAGVNASKNEIIVYLDCDRLLPKDYLSEIMRAIKNDPNCFAYTPNHFIIQKFPGDNILQEALSLHPDEVKKKHYPGVMFEPRFRRPTHFPGKNPMSGSVGFRKVTFEKTEEMGLVDYYYEGHGAFFDSDFFLSTYKKGFNFFELPNLTELHFGHSKRDNGEMLSDKEVGLQGLENFVYYCKKWYISLDNPIKVAKNLKLEKPEEYVNNLLCKLDKQA